jgi:hypothetical protein
MLLVGVAAGRLQEEMSWALWRAAAVQQQLCHWATVQPLLVAAAAL